ncbi:MAG: hypothetical protein JWO88_1858 [Frankiales bacterium]|nr:hypothetical protein [Frankiales bacterium]
MNLNGVELRPLTTRPDTHVIPPEPESRGALPGEVVHGRMLP